MAVVASPSGLHMDETAASSADSEEYQMPCVEALFAATMALMTGFGSSTDAQHRMAMAQKVFGNLSMLSQHPLVSPGLQAMAFKLRLHWLQPHPDATAAPAALATDLQPRALWHTPPEKLQ
jgi:hypothetical protein